MQEVKTNIVPRSSGRKLMLKKKFPPSFFSFVFFLFVPRSNIPSYVPNSRLLRPQQQQQQQGPLSCLSCCLVLLTTAAASAAVATAVFFAKITCSVAAGEAG